MNLGITSNRGAGADIPACHQAIRQSGTVRSPDPTSTGLAYAPSRCCKKSSCDGPASVPHDIMHINKGLQWSMRLRVRRWDDYLARAVFSVRAAMDFSRPWPTRCSPKEYQAPFRCTTPTPSAASSRHPTEDMPPPNMMSNSAALKGAAHLFFTTCEQMTDNECPSEIALAWSQEPNDFQHRPARISKINFWHLHRSHDIADDFIKGRGLQSAHSMLAML